MLSFKKVELSDKVWIDECFSYGNYLNCDYTFGNLFVWSTVYKVTVCHYKEFVICRWGDGSKDIFSPPVGRGDFGDAVKQIIEFAKSESVKPVLYGVTDEDCKKLNDLFPGKFSIEFDEGNFDYIYSVEKMASLSGKKYHGKRNHITNFKKNHPDWSFEILSDDNISECIELHSDWIKEHEDDPEYSYEFESVLCAFENYKELGFIGGAIRTDGHIIAYTMGEPASDNLFVTHFEKAPPEVQGAYPIINQEFTKNCLMNYKYVNREEDLGLEGLRKAKRSYNPEILLSKGVATYEL